MKEKRIKIELQQMSKSLKIALYFIFIVIASCSSIKKKSRYDLIEYEKKGNAISLDSVPIKLKLTFLNQSNISTITRNRNKIDIERKDKSIPFYSIVDLKKQYHYNSKIDNIVVNGTSLDSLEIVKAKFEIGSIQFIRLLTQKDYSGKDFDDLPQVKRVIGNGMLIINTQ